MSNAPVSRLVLLAAAISAIFLLLATTCAQGETIDGAVTPLTSAAEDAAEQAPAPVLPPEPAPPAEAPIDASGETGSAIEAAGGVAKAAGAAIESNAAASAVSAASETVREGTSETVRRTTDEVGQVVAETVAAVDDQAQQLSGLSEEAGTKVAAGAGLGDPARPARQAQSAGTPSSGVLSSPGESPVSESPVSLDKAAHTYGAAQPVGVLPRVHVGGVGNSSAGSRGFPGVGSSWLGALESLDGAPSAPMGGPTGAGSNDPAPLDSPAPAPMSSAAAAGSTGSFFVPLAALLALLALVAPATLRRLGEVTASRPPIPFVCALERPG